MKDVGVAAARTIQSQSESTSCHTRSVCGIDDASLACTDLSSQTTAAALNSAIMNAIRKISHEPQMRNHRFIFYEWNLSFIYLFSTVQLRFLLSYEMLVLALGTKRPVLTFTPSPAQNSAFKVNTCCHHVPFETHSFNMCKLRCTMHLLFLFLNWPFAKPHSLQLLLLHLSSFTSADTEFTIITLAN